MQSMIRHLIHFRLQVCFYIDFTLYLLKAFIASICIPGSYLIDSNICIYTE